jgi:hypothetical protein
VSIGTIKVPNTCYQIAFFTSWLFLWQRKSQHKPTPYDTIISGSTFQKPIKKSYPLSKTLNPKLETLLLLVEYLQTPNDADIQR